MLASERAAFFTSSKTWAMAGLRPMTFSSPKRLLELLAQVAVLDLQVAVAQRPVDGDGQLVHREVLRADSRRRLP